MTIRSTAIASLTALTFLAAQVPTVAFAQGVASTQSEALFNQGKDLIKEKKYHEACDKFSASLKLEETTGTHLALAACLELDGRAASAWGEYLYVVKHEQDEGKKGYARDHAKALESKLLKVHLNMALVPDDLDLKIDNQAIPKETLNSDLPLDPGDHVIEAAAKGKHKWERHVKLGADNSPMTISISLEDMTPEEIKAEQAKQNGGGGGNSGPEVVEEPGNPIKRWIGVGAMALGVAGIVLGIVWLVDATGESSDFSKEGSGIKTCTFDINGVPVQSGGPNAVAPLPCHTTDSSGLTHGDRANIFYIRAGVGGGLGVVLAAVGTVLVLTSFGSKKVVKHDDTGVSFAPILSPTMGGMSVLGRF
jgi:hypothetical protein